jgi:voltage-gated potassium channel
MLALCVFALVLQLLQAVFRGRAEITTILEYADYFLCVVFLVDFGISLKNAPSKWRYFITWGWLDLLSSVPALDAARWARLARIARLARVLRALRASRALSRALFRDRGRAAVLAASLLAFFLIIGSSAAIVHFEANPESNIRDADDALWWSFTTITTVGYGDRFPLTPEGRVIAVLLMTAGVGLFSTLSAALAAWLLAPEGEATDAELVALRAEIASLRALLDERLPK